MNDEIIFKDLEHIQNQLSQNIKNYFHAKRFLVTGGAGFLGSWLCDILTEMGSKVVCQDNLSSGLRRNIDHLLEKKQFEFIESDVREGIVKREFDFVIHLASRASPEDYNLHQIETLLTNSEGTKNALELARECNAVFLYSSTSEVYGDSQLIPTPENYWGFVNPQGIRSCYDEGKRYGEALCRAYQREYGMDIRIVRIFNTYGPRLRASGTYGRAISRFILQAINNQDITIYGDGLHTRSFCYITDTIAGILLFIAKNSSNETINLGNQNEITIKELANIILRKTSSKSKIIHEDDYPDDPKRRNPDISKVKKMLNWEPKIELGEGLENTINWIKKNKI